MRLINIDSLSEGMEIGQDLYDEHNRLLLRRGAAIRGQYVSRLRKMGLPALYVQDADTSDITVAEAIPQAARIKALKNLTDTFNTISSSVEGFRQLSIEAAHQNIQSKKFMDTFRSLTKDDGLDKMLGDVNTMVDQLMNKDVLLGLNTIKTHDGYTFQHSIDVSIMGLVLAKKMGWDEERLRAFGVGCILHDVGKIFIDKEILTKPDRLSDEEFDRMKAHPTMGYELVKTIAPSLNKLVAHVAYQHHERQDGSGYPRGLTGDSTLGENKPNTIHDFGAVCAVADIYDAMASDRPYRQGWPPDRVVALIRELSGKQLNSKVVDIFLRTVAPYPIGTGVRVMNGMFEGFEGVVSDVDDRQLDRPIVRLLFNESTERVDAVEVDLRKEGDVLVQSVRGEGVPAIQPLGSSGSAGASTTVAVSGATEAASGDADGDTPSAESGTSARAEAACPDCGHVSSGKFCTECGSKLQ